MDLIDKLGLSLAGLGMFCLGFTLCAGVVTLGLMIAKVIPLDSPPRWLLLPFGTGAVLAMLGGMLLIGSVLVSIWRRSL